MCANYNDGCCHKHNGMHRFIEVCLLVLLYDGAYHGYSLAEKLSGFGFGEDEINISTLYRTLRKMEQSGWVKSMWEQGGQGPKRRVYEITEKGKSELDDWVDVLKERKKRIERLIDAYTQKTGRKEV